MSSEFIVPVVKLQNLRPHPSADKLELCDVLGYQMCVPKGLHKEGDVMVYFPADACIPNEWAEKFGVKKYLKGKNQDRVGRLRLRGEPSFGLCVALPEGVDWKVGDNVADYFKATKYEPPARVTCGDAAERDPLVDPFFEKFTDIQNGRMFTEVFVDGEPVIITEKIHGCFSADSKILLANGETRSIKEISTGTHVLTYNEALGSTESKEVLAVKCQAPENSRWVRLFLNNAKEILCTVEHRFLTHNRGWVEAQNLTLEDELVERLKSG